MSSNATEPRRRLEEKLVDAFERLELARAQFDQLPTSHNGIVLAAAERQVREIRELLKETQSASNAAAARKVEIIKTADTVSREVVAHLGKKPRGRSPAGHTDAIFQAWIDLGSPSVIRVVCDELARKFYPEEVAAAGTRGRKRLRDRVRGAILRAQKSGTKLPRP